MPRDKAGQDDGVLPQSSTSAESDITSSDSETSVLIKQLKTHLIRQDHEAGQDDGVLPQSSTSAESDITSSDSETSKLIKQLNMGPLSQDEVAAEVKVIYGGLVVLEAKCIEIDNARSLPDSSRLNNS
ncbi:hypothetical protein DL767_002815 [Monosporascus sp. MG133]|nr:hypothetical protein DL767_002815 [Monosporascus sp. MG133]